jgi:antirestriction protein
MSASELDKLYGYLSFDEHDREIISEYLDATGCSLADLDYQDAIDSFYYELESRNQEDQQREFGEYVVNEGLFGVEIPDALQNYIDYEALGRDWLMDFSVSDNGFVFSDN